MLVGCAGVCLVLHPAKVQLCFTEKTFEEYAPVLYCTNILALKFLDELKSFKVINLDLAFAYIGIMFLSVFFLNIGFFVHPPPPVYFFIKVCIVLCA